MLNGSLKESTRGWWRDSLL